MSSFGLPSLSALRNLRCFQILIWQFSASANYGWRSRRQSRCNRTARRSVITLAIENERPLLPKYERSPNDPFLRKLNASGKKWVIIVDPFGRPSFVLDAHHFLRDSLFDTMSGDPEIYWHRPVIVTDMRTPLGDVIGRMKVKPERPEDDVIDNDLILVWGEEKRIITGADLLGRLLRGIVTQNSR